MRELDGCFFCTTPFQIMTSIVITRQLQLRADLYVVNQFSGAEKYCENLADEHIFEMTRVIDGRKYQFRGNRGQFRPFIWCKSIFNYLNINNIGKQLLIKDTTYKKCYISSFFNVANLLDGYFKKNKIATEMVIFDDGVGSYIDRKLLTLSPGEKLLKRIILGQGYSDYNEPQWLYSPDLYYKINTNAKKNIKKISNCFQDDSILNIINRVFEYDSSDNISEDAIILDLIKTSLLNNAERSKLNEIYQKIFEEYGLDNVIVKKHPRDMEDEIKGVHYCKKNQMPFECYCMNMNCNRKILISVSSTSVITPKLLINQEPYVILLYKLIRLNDWDDKQLIRFDEFIRNCKGMYTHQERVMVPKNMHELTICLKTAYEICRS